MRQGPSMPRLVRVELRKATDTRSGRWLLGVLVLLGVAVVGLLLVAGKANEVNFPDLLLLAQIPIALLLPVIGILTVTSEWTQRTALTTFSLTPDRWRVMLAKTLAMLLLALVAVAASILAAAAGNLIAVATGNDQAHWGSAAIVGRVALFQLLTMLVGLGLGTLLLSAPQAIVGLFIAPTLITVLASFSKALEKPSRWIDVTGTTSRLLGDPMNARAWGQIATAVAVWAVLPLLLGWVRVDRRDVQ